MPWGPRRMKAGRKGYGAGDRMVTERQEAAKRIRQKAGGAGGGIRKLRGRGPPRSGRGVCFP